MADDQTTTVFYDPAWIAGAGGYLHPNNVLWYFALSPFFDPESANGELIAQYKGKMPEENELLGSKEGWHQQLRMRRGLQYVVLHDPFETKAQVDGPLGKEQSNLWIVRKQQRDEPNDDNVKVLGFYFIANEAIFEAPSIASILSTRMLNTTTALNNLFSTASRFPIFSASHGHTYEKPTQKTITPSQKAAPRQSKEGTPMTVNEPVTADKEPKTTDQGVSAVDEDSGLLDFAFNRTMQFGKQYSDDAPLVGEPKNLRFSTTRQQTGASHPNLPGPSQRSVLSGATPAQSRAPSIMPQGKSPFRAMKT